MPAGRALTVQATRWLHKEERGGQPGTTCRAAAGRDMAPSGVVNELEPAWCGVRSLSIRTRQVAGGSEHAAHDSTRTARLAPQRARPRPLTTGSRRCAPGRQRRVCVGACPPRGHACVRGYAQACACVQQGRSCDAVVVSPPKDPAQGIWQPGGGAGTACPLQPHILPMQPTHACRPGSVRGWPVRRECTIPASPRARLPPLLALPAGVRTS